MIKNSKKYDPQLARKTVCAVIKKKKKHFEGPVFRSDMAFSLFMKNVRFQSTSLCPLGIDTSQLNAFCLQ